MADQVTDNRTDIADGTAVSGWEDLAGTALAVDTDIRYDTFSGSIGNYVTTTVDGTMFNNSTTGLFTSGDHAYLLINCGVVSLLHTKANRGCAVRVTGATATDWAEFELFGSDEWPVTFDGGWAQIVVDIDELLLNPTNTNGTPPTVGNIQRFGVTFETNTVMPRMTDNFWVGGFRILAANTPALIVEGRSGGSLDWTLELIRSVAAVQLSAVLKPGPAETFVCRGPIQFGINDTSTHAFLDTNKSLLWDFQEVMLDGFYKLSALGNSGGSTNVTFGIKTGTGNDAVGSQGGAIQAGASGARWDMDFDDPDVDGVNFYGTQLIHGGNFQLDDAAVSVISSNYIDVTKVVASGSEQLRCAIIAPNTMASPTDAFMDVADISDIVNCSFEFASGHAIEILPGGPDSQDSIGNTFTGAFGGTPGDNLTPNSGSADAMIYNNRANSPSLLTLNVSGGGTTPSVRNGTVDTTDVENNISTTLTGMKDNTEVMVCDQSLNQIAHIENATTGTTDDRSFTFSAAAGVIVDITIFNVDYVLPPNNRIEDFEIPTSDGSIPISQVPDRTVSNPA